MLSSQQANGTSWAFAIIIVKWKVFWRDNFQWKNVFSAEDLRMKFRNSWLNEIWKLSIFYVESRLIGWCLNGHSFDPHLNFKSFFGINFPVISAKKGIHLTRVLALVVIQLSNNFLINFFPSLSAAQTDPKRSARIAEEK